MHVRIIDRPAFRLVGRTARVPLIPEGLNPHIQAHVAAVSMAEHLRLKALSNIPDGLLQVMDDLDPRARRDVEARPEDRPPGGQAVSGNLTPVLAWQR